MYCLEKFQIGQLNELREPCKIDMLTGSRQVHKPSPQHGSQVSNVKDTNKKNLCAKTIVCKTESIDKSRQKLESAGESSQLALRLSCDYRRGAFIKTKSSKTIEIEYQSKDKQYGRRSRRDKLLSGQDSRIKDVMNFHLVRTT